MMNPLMGNVSNGGGTGSSSSTQRLYITHVDAFGPYLRISGQLNPDAMGVVRAMLQQMLSTCFAIDPNWPMTRQKALLLPGALGLFKCIHGAAPADCEFMRARILSLVPNTKQLQVEVEFIDYGRIEHVDSYELLFPQHPELLEKIPSLCTQYVILGICTDWKKTQLDEILRMIMHKTLDICIQMEYHHFKFITLKWKEFDFAEFLIHQKKIGAPIGNDLLRDNFIKILKQHKFYSDDSGTLQLPNNNNNNNNNSANANNNNYYTNNNNNNIIATSAVNTNALYAGAGSGINQARELIAERRSLAARLQRAQQPQMQNVVMHPVQPRMPHSIGNLRSMMQGIHVQNNRIPFTGPNFHHQPPQPTTFNGIAVMPSAAPLPLNIYNARYQRPQEPPALAGINNSRATNGAPPSPVRRTTAATFKSNNLSVGCIYDVCVSFVENGPCLFSIQLAAAQAELTEMMNQIENIPLKQFTEKPVLGTACIARYSEDGQLYRALITSVQPMACKVAYIDYGNAELVKFRDLYEIPDEFLSAKAFAIRFTLSGNKELEPIDESLKKAFKDVVIYKNCKLKVMPLEGPPLVQYCELYLQDKNILDVLKQIQKCRLVYAKTEPLQNNDIVEIRYIDSPKHFYVQKVANIAKFEQLMDDMFLYYNKNQLVPNHLALGAPCIVKYDNEWYRAEVMRADSTAIIVRHVDFGYEQKVTKNLLSNIAEQHLQLPRQAVQCCLKGFENNELNKDLATTQFEMLAEESNRKRRSFTVKVFRIQPDGVNLVNLCTKDLNVMKKLYKLSMPFERYLTLEKEEFNVHNGNSHRSTAGESGYPKTPSITSSNDVPPTTPTSAKKANILNSTTLKSDERQQQKNVQKAPRPPHNMMSSNPANISNTEWDKHSSASSMDNRDSRSSSSEHKQGKYRQQQQQQQQQRHRGNQQQNMLNLSIASSNDRRSNGSVGSGGGGSSGGNSFSKNRNAAAVNNMSPRSHNNKQENDNRRHNKQNQQQQQSMSHQQQHQRTPQRSQNAPQGYSQQRQNKGTSNTSQRSYDANSINSTDEQQLHNVSEEYVPLTSAFPYKHIETPAREEVVICWWVSPHQFFTHVKSQLVEFEQLMLTMQKFYKKKPLQQLQLKVGLHVVARHRKGNVVYRARVLACNQMLRKYKVHCVDFGNQYTVTSEDIWQVEKRFAEFPCMAYLCSFNGIVSNFDHLDIIDRMEKYLPTGSTLMCEYIEREQDMYYVNINVDNVSLKETLKTEGIIAEICPELRLDLLAGQQIRVKISDIKDMLNFKIQIEGCDEKIKLLCSYDDVRYVKSNPDIAEKFKTFYEGKSSVVNIKDVNENKVILLRPLLPLLKDDIPTYICTYPLILESFNVRVVYIASAYRLYAQLISNEMEVAQLLDEMYEFYEKDGILLGNFANEQICAANGSDGNWYRARIVTTKQNANDPVEVYYVDYGNTETLEKTKLKRLDEKFFTNKSAYAIEINLPIRTLTESNKAKKPTYETEVAAVTIALKQLTLDQVMSVKALEMRHNRLLAELLMPDHKNVVDALKQQQLIKGRDVEYMRKVIDREPRNMFEYIEMVDLTLEDEDELEKRQTQSKKSQSPKKKKPVVAVVNKPDEEQVKPVVVAETIAEPVAVAKVVANDSAEIKSVATEVVATANPVTIEVVVPAVPEPEPITESEPESIDSYAHMEHGTLSSCVNPAHFFVHPQDKLDELYKLQENLQIVASSLPPLMRVINGAHCISLYSVDKQWYRAKIVDAELMALQFIDYGNTDCVSDTSDVKEMSVFPDIEPLCIPCALPIQPNGTVDWLDAANAIFNESYNSVLNFEYLTHGDAQTRSFINLFIDGVNIAEYLIKQGHAKTLQMVNSGQNCYISHVLGLTDFFIQYEKDAKVLEMIEIYLSDGAQQLQKLEKFEHSRIVAACFPDDGLWYRAKLLQQLPNDAGYKVLFIDYGNTSVASECCEMSPEIAKLPPLSTQCAIQLPANCLSWSEAAEEKFTELTDSGNTIFTVELREPKAEYAEVHLYIDGYNISDTLAPLCVQKPTEELESIEINASFGNSSLNTTIDGTSDIQHDAIISHANSPCDFYVQFNKDAARLEDMTVSINSLTMGVLEQPEVGQICAAEDITDNALYRARILEIVSAVDKQYRVLFIDFGNEALSGNLRLLPQDLQQLKSFSRHCQLENSHRFAQLASVAAETFNALIDACDGLVKVEILPNETTPNTVKLFAANSSENLCDKLNRLLGMDAVSVSSLNAINAGNSCLISYAPSPKRFYIQLTANSTKMELVSKALQKPQVEKLPQLGNVEIDRVCSVYCGEEDCYYRGRVQSVLASDAGYEIYLLDHGNSIHASLLRELPEQLCAIPALALCCTLNALPTDVPDSLLDARFAALVEAHFGEVFEIESDEIVDAETRLHSVKLQVNYKDLCEELTKAVNAAEVSLTTVVPTLHNCSVIHVNSPASFYIQLTDDVAAVEQITDQLLDAERDFELFTALHVGAICAAQFPEDGAYYRAKIVNVLDGEDVGKCEVHYLDFGNNCVTDQFRVLPESMLNLTGYSKHCTLDVNFGTPAACAHFQALIDARFSETFQVEFLKISEVEPNICRIFHQNKNVVTELLQLLKGSGDDTWQSNEQEPPVTCEDSLKESILN